MSSRKFPRHLTLKDDILHLIRNGSYQSNDKLPSETELAQMFHTSRTTIRKALELLQSEDHIERLRGMGTFIRKKMPVVSYSIDRLSSLREILDISQSAIKTIRLKIEHSKADAATASCLQIEEGSDVIVFDRVRSIFDVPAVRSIDTIPESIVPKSLSLENMGISLSKFLRVHLWKSEAKIVPYKATAELADLLQIAPESLCLMIEETTYNTKGIPIDYSHEYYISHLFNFKITRNVANRNYQ